jgi:uncharacterized membrane protein (UPF0127 family)
MNAIASVMLLFWDLDAASLPKSPVTTSSYRVLLNGRSLHVHRMSHHLDRFFGLMGMHQWPINHALMFDGQSRSFWMRNVPILLDLVFFDSNGCVLDFQTAVPYSHQLISIPPQAEFTFELGGGAISYYQIQKADCLSDALYDF